MTAEPTLLVDVVAVLEACAVSEPELKKPPAKVTIAFWLPAMRTVRELILASTGVAEMAPRLMKL